MPKSYRLAVVVANQDQVTGPSIADCRQFIETGQDSVLAYWRDNAADWFTVSSVDYYGPVMLTDIPPKATRGDVIDMAIAAVGMPLAAHDLLVVLFTRVEPGTFDTGARGRRALIPTDNSHTYACHELGHTVGLNHTCGIPNNAVDGDPDDEVNVISPWYGDPYDLMSASMFGNSEPNQIGNIGSLPPPSAVNGFPASRIAGPMLSRAMLHHTDPGGIRADQVLHAYQNQTSEAALLYPVGSHDQPTLLVWHPTEEDDAGRGRVYVEYRQPFDHIPASRWDRGLAQGGAARDRCGVVVHVVKDVPHLDYYVPAVWYSGRIVPQSPDEDVVVDTGRGYITVSLLSDSDDDPVAPVRVRVRVGLTARSYVRIEETPTEEVTTTELPGQSMPGFEFMGPFSRERRSVLRTVVYSPRVYGLGGESHYDDPTSVQIRWYLGGYMLIDDSGYVERIPAGATAPVMLYYVIDSATGAFTLSNTDAADSFVLDVQCTALAGEEEVSAHTTYEAPGATEGWGDAGRRFLKYWDRITHPIPKIKVRPPGWGRFEAEQLDRDWQELYAARPMAAQALWPMHKLRLQALRPLQQ